MTFCPIDTASLTKNYYNNSGAMLPRALEAQDMSAWQLSLLSAQEKTQRISEIEASNLSTGEKIIGIQDVLESYQPSAARQRQQARSADSFVTMLTKTMTGLKNWLGNAALNFQSATKSLSQKVVKWIAEAANILSAKALGVATPRIEFGTAGEGSALIASYSPDTKKILVNTDKVQSLSDLASAIYHENVHHEQHAKIDRGAKDDDTLMLAAADKYYWFKTLGSALYPDDKDKAASLSSYFYMSNPQEKEAFAAYDRVRAGMQNLSV